MHVTLTMTLVLRFDLDIMVTYFDTENKVVNRPNGLNAMV